MVRNIKFDHNVEVTGSNDGTKQISKDAWNDGHNEAGMFGHGTVTTLTVATGAVTPINDMHKLDGEGAAADDLATITNTEAAEFDEIWLLSGAQTITLVNSGNIVTLTGLDTIISTTVAIKLFRVGTTWYENGKVGATIFSDAVFAVQDDGDATKQMLVQLAGATTTFDTILTFVQTADRTVTFPDATDTLVGKATTDIFTNKSYDLGGTGNVLTGSLAEFNTALQSESFATLGTAQSFTAKQTFQDDSIDISNPADTFQYTLQAAAIVADRILNLPLITATDTLVTLGLANAWGDVLQTFKDDKFKINSPDDADGVTFVNSNQTAERNLTIPVLTGNRSIVVTTEASQIVLGTEVTGASTALTDTANLVRTTTANTFGDFAQTFLDNQFFIQNPAATFEFQFIAGAIAADRTVTLPVLGANDTFAFIGNAQSWTAKQTFQDDSIDISNPADTFQYTIQAAAIAADRVLTLPLSTAADTLTSIGVANAWGTVNQNISSTGEWQEGGIAISPIGLHDTWIPASAMWLATTLPATGLTQRELGTNDVDIQTMDFTSTTADEAVQFTWTIPKEWNGGTITLEFFWTATGGAAGNVRWGAQATAFANDNPLDAAFGIIQEVTDAFIANDDLHISAATGALTIAGSPVAGEMVQFKVLRSGSDAADTFATTAGLLGVRVNYTTNSAQG